MTQNVRITSGKTEKKTFFAGEQWWRGDESTRSPPMWPGVDSDPMPPATCWLSLLFVLLLFRGFFNKDKGPDVFFYLNIYNFAGFSKLKSTFCSSCVKEKLVTELRAKIDLFVVFSVDLLHSLFCCPWCMCLVLCSDCFRSWWCVRGRVHYGLR